ncbi:hypothetical protein ACQPYA_03870 [Micromonospora sp. CA-263727]|uniref:hypothetical protein n=1 Tax=Micromonospora sp. CA-263727 TaxID=3239967 RepID=UPI003D8F92FA
MAQALPGAHTLHFAWDHDDTWFGVTLEAIRGPAGELLWYGDLFADGPEAKALNAAGGPATRYFDTQTETALGEVIQVPADLDRSLLQHSRVQRADPDRPAHLVALDVASAVAGALAACEPDAIAVDLLSALLADEKAVLDVEDVAPLVDWLRRAVTGTRPGHHEQEMTAVRAMLRGQPAGDGLPTTYGTRDGFAYERFRFGPDFPVPLAHVAAHGMAYFRGVDGHLWFAPDSGRRGEYDWDRAQNVAEFDLRTVPGNRSTSGYLPTIKRLCRAVDAVQAADDDYRFLHTSGGELRERRAAELARHLSAHGFSRTEGTYMLTDALMGARMVIQPDAYLLHYRLRDGRPVQVWLAAETPTVTVASVAVGFVDGH